MGTHWEGRKGKWYVAIVIYCGATGQRSIISQNFKWLRRNAFAHPKIYKMLYFMGVTYIQPNKHCFGQPPPTKH